MDRDEAAHDSPAPFAVVAGSAHPELADRIAAQLGVTPLARTLERFPDGEAHAVVDADLGDRDVLIVQPTAHPAGEHLLELLLLGDACWRSSPRSITAVIPYFGYARQDRRTRPGEALGVRVIADLLAAGHVTRVVAVDVHGDAVEGCLGVPLVHVSGVAALADALRPHVGRDSVIVAPDFGATKLARGYARELGLPLAVVHKTRTSGAEVQATRVLGDVAGLRPIVVDDMITTGGTIVAAVNALTAAGCAGAPLVAATHALFVPPAFERLATAAVGRFFFTDTLPPPASFPFPHEVVGIAGAIAAALGAPATSSRRSDASRSVGARGSR